jgi:Flp pilus assembly protein TadG
MNNKRFKHNKRKKYFFLKNTRGAAAVELGLILPAFVLLMLGGMDLGHMFYMQHVITNASREGARYAANYNIAGNPPSSSAVSAYVKTTLNYDSFNFSNFNVSLSPSGGSPNILTVTVHADKNWWILNTLPGFTNPKQLTATTAMQFEGS